MTILVENRGSSLSGTSLIRESLCESLNELPNLSSDSDTVFYVVRDSCSISWKTEITLSYQDEKNSFLTNPYNGTIINKDSFFLLQSYCYLRFPL